MADHHIVVVTNNPHAPTLLGKAAGLVAGAGWDTDPLTGRQYPAEVLAYLVHHDGRAEAVKPLPPAVRMPVEVQSRLEALAGRLERVLADLRAGRTTDYLADVEDALDALRDLTGPVPAPAVA